MKIYSKFHPSFRQSSLSEFEIFELFKKLNPIKVTLNPGDLLFIPPFYFHHVISDKNVR
jgi:ribosomal protein L16 Arg81 hydroxylase